MCHVQTLSTPPPRACGRVCVCRVDTPHRPPTTHNPPEHQRKRRQRAQDLAAVQGQQPVADPPLLVAPAREQEGVEGEGEEGPQDDEEVRRQALPAEGVAVVFGGGGCGGVLFVLTDARTYMDTSLPPPPPPQTPQNAPDRLAEPPVVAPQEPHQAVARGRRQKQGQAQPAAADPGGAPVVDRELDPVPPHCCCLLRCLIGAGGVGSGGSKGRRAAAG